MAVVNSQGNSFFSDLYKAATNVFSVRRGARVEAEAVGALNSLVKSLVAENRSVDIIGFSQGGLIIQNALYKLRETEPELWQKAQGKINVHTWGIDVVRWPDGVNVEKYNFTENDTVAVASSVGSHLKRLTSSTRRGFERFAGVPKGDRYRRFADSHSGDYVCLDIDKEGYVHDLVSMQKLMLTNWG